MLTSAREVLWFYSGRTKRSVLPNLLLLNDRFRFSRLNGCPNPVSLPPLFSWEEECGFGLSDHERLVLWAVEGGRLPGLLSSLRPNLGLVRGSIPGMT